MNLIRPHRRPSLARLKSQEGFSLIELMVAMGVILIALIAMAYTVTVSLSNVAFARQRDGANALADRTMEQIRALPFTTIQAGLDNTVLKNGQGGCPSGSYCFPVTPSANQCPSGVPGYGERIPHGTNPSLVPLVPHQQTRAVGPTPYVVSTYISYLCDSMASNTFRVTVMVSWPNAAIHGVSSKVTTQSVFYSQSGGCVGSQTHPFAAPCQPFSYGTADVQNGTVGISGDVSVLNSFDPAVSPPVALDLPEFTSNLSIEQITAAQGVSTTSGVTLDMNGSPPARAGYAKDTTGADNDPAQPGQTYQQTTPNPKTGPGAASVSTSSGGSSLTLTSSGGDTYGSTSTTSGSVANPCTNNSGTSQTDNQPCGNASAWQQGALSAVLDLKPPSGGDLGNITLASVMAASARSYGFTNRDVTPQPGTCVGTSGDGCIHADVVRSIGAFTVGGFPANLPAPVGWNGSLLQVTNFNDSASAESGVGGSNPAATASGALSYWNGAGYTTCTIGTDCPATVSTARIDIVTIWGGGTIEVLIPAATWTVGTATTTKNVPPSAPDTLPACAGTGLCIANASGVSTSPVSGNLRYIVNALGGASNLADLTLHVDLGTLQATTRYKPSS
jgi:prepilin-type N-terminal cleavage/methylation domain-containing protein